MKKYNLTWAIFLSIILIITLSACTKAKNNLIYINDEYGFRIEFPESWGGEFEVVPYDYGLVISSEVNDIGTLAYIHKYTTKEWQDLNYGADIPVEYQTLGESLEGVLILIYPSDVNYNMEDKNSIKRNEEMKTDLIEENFTFELVD